MNLVARAGRVKPDETGRLGRGQLVVSLCDLAMKIDRLLLHPVLALARLLVAAETCLDRPLEEKGDVRARECRRPCRGYATPAALIRKRRIVKAVRDHHLAGRERGGDDLRDQLPARGHEEVHLRLRVDLE